MDCWVRFNTFPYPQFQLVGSSTVMRFLAHTLKVVDYMGMTKLRKLIFYQNEGIFMLVNLPQVVLINKNLAAATFSRFWKSCQTASPRYGKRIIIGQSFTVGTRFLVILALLIVKINCFGCPLLTKAHSKILSSVSIVLMVQKRFCIIAKYSIYSSFVGFWYKTIEV